MSIGKNIKNLRESRNLTQAELGKIAGVTDKAVSTWENGTADPRMGAIQKIADYFGVKKSDLLDDECRCFSAVPEPQISADEQRFLEMYRALDTEDRAEIRGFMKGLLAASKYQKGLSGEQVI